MLFKGLQFGDKEFNLEQIDELTTSLSEVDAKYLLA